MNKSKKASKVRNSAVLAVHKSETADGHYHEVLWALDGNLSTAQRLGNVKRFRIWTKAKSFAGKRAKQLGCRAMFI